MVGGFAPPTRITTLSQRGKGKERNTHTRTLTPLPLVIFLMSAHPPSSGPNRQPLQTYLGSAVRPTPTPTATPNNPPTTQTNNTQTQPTPPPTDLFQQAPSSTPAAFGSSDVFSTPSLFGGVSSSLPSLGSLTVGGSPAGVGADHLSSLLATEPDHATNQRHSVFADARVSGAPPLSSSPPVNVSLTSPPPTKLESTADHPLGFGTPNRTPAAPPPMQPSQSPVRMNRAVSTPLTAAPINPLQASPPVPAQPQPVETPEEKLASLMQQLFRGPPPPSKLAAFDLASVERSVAGLMRLSEHGFWKELIRIAELMLADTNATREPHVTYQCIHLYLVALLKMRKFEQAHTLIQSKIGNPFSSDKLYSSHSVYAGTSHVGNMLPFDLHLLIAEMSHYHGGKTRAALDGLMKLLQWVRAQIQRKKNEEASAGVTNGTTPATPTDTTNTTAASSVVVNPFSIHSPHTATELTLSQLQSHLKSLRIRISNLHLSFTSSLDIDFEQSLAWIDELIREYPDDTDLYENGSKILLQMGDIHRASAYLEKAKEIYQEKGDKDNVNIGLHQSETKNNKNKNNLRNSVWIVLFILCFCFSFFFFFAGSSFTSPATIILSLTPVSPLSTPFILIISMLSVTMPSVVSM